MVSSGLADSLQTTCGALPRINETKALQAALKQELRLPLELGEHIGHHRAAFDGLFCAVVVLEQSEHVSAVLHGQTADQLLHHLTRGKHIIFRL